jgi:hypothetical protein
MMKDRLFLSFILLACKKLKYSKKEARDLLVELSILMETKSDEEAEEGFQWYESLEEERRKNQEIQPPKKGIKPKDPKKVTRFSKNYRSKLSKENERLLELIRSHL